MILITQSNRHDYTQWINIPHSPQTWRVKDWLHMYPLKFSTTFSLKHTFKANLQISPKTFPLQTPHLFLTESSEAKIFLAFSSGFLFFFCCTHLFLMICGRVSCSGLLHLKVVVLVQFSPPLLLRMAAMRPFRSWSVMVIMYPLWW